MFSRQAKVIRDAKGRLIKTTARGYQVLRDPALVKGMVFSAQPNAVRVVLHGSAARRDD